jgi:hypothetical protein
VAHLFAGSNSLSGPEIGKGVGGVKVEFEMQSLYGQILESGDTAPGFGSFSTSMGKPLLINAYKFWKG